MLGAALVAPRLAGDSEADESSLMGEGGEGGEGRPPIGEGERRSGEVGGEPLEEAGEPSPASPPPSPSVPGCREPATSSAVCSRAEGVTPAGGCTSYLE